MRPIYVRHCVPCDLWVEVPGRWPKRSNRPGCPSCGQPTGGHLEVRYAEPEPRPVEGLPEGGKHYEV